MELSRRLITELEKEEQEMSPEETSIKTYKDADECKHESETSLLVAAERQQLLEARATALSLAMTIQTYNASYTKKPFGFPQSLEDTANQFANFILTGKMDVKKCR